MIVGLNETIQDIFIFYYKIMDTLCYLLGDLIIIDVFYMISYMRKIFINNNMHFQQP